MKIYSKNIINNWLDEEFGNNTSNKSDIINDINIKSFHIAWDNLPKNTKSLALVFDDDDAIEVCGFTWMHWSACNINPEWKELPINASVEWRNKFIQGKNSWSSPLLNNGQWQEISGYGGCAPPNKNHLYKVTIYALDTLLDLTQGFYLNELINQMQGHVLDSCCMKFWYKKIK